MKSRLMIIILILLLAVGLTACSWFGDGEHGGIIVETRPSDNNPTKPTVEAQRPTLPNIDTTEPSVNVEPTIDPNITIEPTGPKLPTSIFDVKPTHSTINLSSEMKDMWPSSDTTTWWPDQTYIILTGEFTTFESVVNSDRQGVVKSWDEIKIMELSELNYAGGAYFFLHNTGDDLRVIRLDCSATTTVEQAISNGFWGYSIEIMSKETCEAIFNTDYILNISYLIQLYDTPTEIYYRDQDDYMYNYIARYDFNGVSHFISALELDNDSYKDIVEIELPAGVAAFQIVGSEYLKALDYQMNTLNNIQ